MVSTRVIEDIENAKVGLAKSGVRLVTTKAQAYFMDTGFVPNKLADLITQSAQVDNWRGPYLTQTQALDPWSVPYVLKAPGDHGALDVISTGPDRQPGGLDIGNWE